MPDLAEAEASQNFHLWSNAWRLVYKRRPDEDASVAWIESYEYDAHQQSPAGASVAP